MDWDNLLGVLHLNNNMHNKIEKFEVLKEVTADQIAIINREIKEIRDLLLEVKVNNTKLFKVVKQGSR